MRALAIRRRVAAAAATLVVVGAAGCSSGSSDSPATRVVADPCGAISDCDPAGAGTIAPGNALQGIAVVEGVDGSAEVRVAFGDQRGVVSAVVPRAAYIYSEAVTRTVALHELDGKPGNELVVARGSDGTHAWFGVFTFDGAKLVPLPAPASVQDERTGMWRLFVGQRQDQVRCVGQPISVTTTSLGDDYFACANALIRDVRYR